MTNRAFSAQWIDILRNGMGENRMKTNAMIEMFCVQKVNYRHFRISCVFCLDCFSSLVRFFAAAAATVVDVVVANSIPRHFL